MIRFIEVNIVSGIKEIDPTSTAEDLTEKDADFAIDCANSVNGEETWKVNEEQFNAIHETFGINKLTKFVIRAYESRLDGMAGQSYYVGYNNDFTDKLSDCDLYDTYADCAGEIKRIEENFASCWTLRVDEVDPEETEQ